MQLGKVRPTGRTVRSFGGQPLRARAKAARSLLLSSATFDDAELDRRAQRSRRSRRTLVAADLAVVLGALCLANSQVPPVFGPRTPFGGIAALTLASTASWYLAMAWQRIHVTRFVVQRTDEWRRLVATCVAGSLATVVVAFLWNVQLSRTWLLTAGGIALAGLVIEREVARSVFGRRRLAGNRRPVLVVGRNDEAANLVIMLDDPSLGYDVVGTMEVDGDCDEDIVAPVLAAIEATGATGAIISTTSTSSLACNRLARRLTDCGIHVEIPSPLIDIAPERLSLHRLGRVPMMYLRPVARNGWRPRAKRGFDILVASGALVLLTPVLLLTALAVRLDSPGPVLFRQERVGRDGVHFKVLKFRSMVVDAARRQADLQALNEADGPLFKMSHDPRVTRVGRLIRRASIDEIPQLWNVVRGEMSLVGPRPALPSEIEGWHDRLFDRLRVAPGMTGMWQVSGRSNASFADYSRHDLYYVDNWSLATDLSIIVRTFPAVLLRRGAR